MRGFCVNFEAGDSSDGFRVAWAADVNVDLGNRGLDWT